MYYSSVVNETIKIEIDIDLCNIKDENKLMKYIRKNFVFGRYRNPVVPVELDNNVVVYLNNFRDYWRLKNYIIRNDLIK